MTIRDRYATYAAAAITGLLSRPQSRKPEATLADEAHKVALAMLQKEPPGHVLMEIEQGRRETEPRPVPRSG